LDAQIWYPTQMGMGESSHADLWSTDKAGFLGGQVAAQSQPAYAWLAPASAAKTVQAVDVRVRPRQVGAIYSQRLEIAKVIQDHITPGLITDSYA
jgi:hypothetical protein